MTLILIALVGMSVSGHAATSPYFPFDDLGTPAAPDSPLSEANAWNNPAVVAATKALGCSSLTYLTQRPDVAAANMNPYDHYILYGRGEGMCAPSQCTSAQYFQMRPDVARSGMTAQLHYRQYGFSENMCEPSGRVSTLGVAASASDTRAPANASAPVAQSFNYTLFPGALELITDREVKTGFQETDACPNVSDTITAAGCATNVQRNVANGLWPAMAGKPPLWTIQQWGSRLSMPGGGGTPYGDGLKWDDGTKHMALFPNGTIEMGVNGLADWGGVYPQAQPSRPGWPSQTLGFAITPGGNGANSPGGALPTFKNLFFQMDARLSEWIPNQRDGFDPSKNKTTMGAFISIANLDPTSAGYGQFIWFSIPVFDTTTVSQPKYDAMDLYGDGLGTGMLIYTPGFAAFSTGNMRSGDWVHFGADILPYVQAAVDEGVAKGALKDSNKSHYFVGGFTIGWETLAFDQTSIQFKNVSIQVTH